jgi:hypothetical protein
MREYFARAKQQPGGVRVDNKSLWSNIEAGIDTWSTNVCADRRLNENLVPRAKEAILHRSRNLLAMTIRESLGEWVGQGDWLEAVQKLKEQGKIKFFGISINDYQPENAIKLIGTGAVDVANNTLTPQLPSPSAAALLPITLILTSLVSSVRTSAHCSLSRLSPRCSVLSVIPWSRQNSLRDRPLVPYSATSRWTSWRVRLRRTLTSSDSVIRPLQQIPTRGGRWVEWGSGAVATEAAPFPDPAHQTGRAGLASGFRTRVN